MARHLKPLVNWFGYTGRERRASLILLVIIVLVLAVRYAIPERRIEIEDISAMLVPEAVPLKYSKPEGDDTSFNRKYRSGSRRIYSNNYSLQTKKIELNQCDSAALERLPGIGPVLSVRIIKYRNLLGGYASVSQLKEVYGLPDSTFNLISGRLTADSTFIKKINVNTAGFGELNRHPYLERYDVQGILKYREMKGGIRNVSELVNENILTGEKAFRILPYLSFD